MVKKFLKNIRNAMPFILGYLLWKYSGNIVNHLLGLSASDGRIFIVIQHGVPMILSGSVIYYVFKKLNLKKAQMGEEAMADEIVEKILNYLEIPDEVEEDERESVIMEYIKQNGNITLKKAMNLLWCGQVKTKNVLEKLIIDGKLTKEKKFFVEYYSLK